MRIWLRFLEPPQVAGNSAVGMVLPSSFLGTKKIPWCDAVTDLRVVIDGRLRFDRQVTRVCSRVYAALHRLRLLKFLTPKRVRMKLCNALLFLYFFYCDIVFPHLSFVDIRRLQVAFNSCTRYVFNLRRYDPLIHTQE
jgi:hypothetical protein